LVDLGKIEIGATASVRCDRSLTPGFGDSTQAFLAQWLLAAAVGRVFLRARVIIVGGAVGEEALEHGDTEVLLVELARIPSNSLSQVAISPGE
jgi:hypothetical protein